VIFRVVHERYESLLLYAGKGGVPKPKVLILAPTRELAMQSQQVVEDLADANQSRGTYASIRSVCVYGGVNKSAQRQALLGENVQIVVATPGRLQDLIEEGALDLSGNPCFDKSLNAFHLSNVLTY
jgi:superfamily II DNA/RNA helicase